MKKQRSQRDLYQEITDRIVERLEAGDLPPWRQPIRGAGDDPFPKNLSTGKSYRGINVWLLALTSWTEGYGSRYWMTFRQVKALGGQVRKGERGSLVTFWKPYEKTDPTTDEKTILPVLKHYTVFNAEQIEGVTPPDTLTADPNEPPFLPIAQAQGIVEGFAGSPAIEHHGSRAAYFPQEDVVRIAPPERFETPEAYYGTLYHELTHATGHSRRLDRGLDTQLAPFGTPDYSKEELVAAHEGPREKVAEPAKTLDLSPGGGVEQEVHTKLDNEAIARNKEKDEQMAAWRDVEIGTSRSFNTQSLPPLQLRPQPTPEVLRDARGRHERQSGGAERD